MPFMIFTIPTWSLPLTVYLPLKAAPRNGLPIRLQGCLAIVPFQIVYGLLTPEIGVWWAVCC